MRKKEILLEGMYAGTALATLFWVAELFSRLLVEIPSLAGRRYAMPLDMGDIVRSLPIYLLFCLVLGVFLAGLLRSLSFMYAALLVVGTGLFEWASQGEGALRILGGSPWVRREIWTAGFIFLGYLWWRYLRRRTTEEIRRDGISSFLIVSTFLVTGYHLSMEFAFMPFLKTAPHWRSFARPTWIYGTLATLALLSVLSFFLVRERIRPLMKRRALQGTLAFSLLISLAAYTPRWLPTVSPEKPNMILIVLDTVRADHLSSYHYPKQTTPYLDRLAREGVLFEEAKANAHWTLPSHASLFTGLSPSRHGAISGQSKIRRDCETLAERLRAEGYRTVGVSANLNVGRLRDLDRGFDQFVELGQNNRRSLARRLQTRFARQSPLDASNVNRFLDLWLTYHNRRDARPFFLFVNYLDAHETFVFHPGISEAFLTKPWSKREIASLPPSQDNASFFAGMSTYSERELRLLRGLYDGEIAYLDRFLEEWIEALRRKGLLDKSVLVITSDHGEYFGEHHLMGHVVGLYEEVLHVPLLMRYPKEIPVKRITVPVQLTDIPPTLLELARLRGLDSVEGKSLVPLFSSGGNWEPQPVVAEQHPFVSWLTRLKQLYPKGDFNSYNYSSYSFQEGRYKAILSSDRPPELYDLQGDKKESRDLYQTFQDHPIWTRAANYLKEKQEEQRQATFNSPEETTRGMRSLGYL